MGPLPKLWQWLACRVWWRHDLYMIGQCSEVTLHLGCRACRKEWAANFDLDVVMRWEKAAQFYHNRGYRT